MSKFLQDDNDDSKAIATPPVFSKNSQAKNVTLIFDLTLTLQVIVTYVPKRRS